MGRLDGKVAIITGSTSGMGRDTAYLFAKEGAKVVVTGRNEARAKQVVDNIKAEGGEAIYVIADTADGEVRIKADNVVECVGYAPNGDLFEALRYGKAKPYQIGDAAGVANILNAIWSAYELASNI